MPGSRVIRHDAAVAIRTSLEGGRHLRLRVRRCLDEHERAEAHKWLAARTGADPASTSGAWLASRTGSEAVPGSMSSAWPYDSRYPDESAGDRSRQIHNMGRKDLAEMDGKDVSGDSAARLNPTYPPISTRERRRMITHINLTGNRHRRIQDRE